MDRSRTWLAAAALMFFGMLAISLLRWRKPLRVDSVVAGLVLVNMLIFFFLFPRAFDWWGGGRFLAGFYLPVGVLGILRLSGRDD